MQIGMATTTPTTVVQKTKLLSLAMTLAEAAKQAENLKKGFGSESEVVTVEGRPLEALLAAVAKQLIEVVQGHPDREKKLEKLIANEAAKKREQTA